jgi:hypothetical protein
VNDLRKAFNPGGRDDMSGAAVPLVAVLLEQVQRWPGASPKRGPRP